MSEYTNFRGDVEVLAALLNILLMRINSGRPEHRIRPVMPVMIENALLPHH